MKPAIIALFFSFAFMLMGPVSADSKYYFGVAAITTDDDSIVDLDTTGLDLKFGREFSKYLSIEGRVAVSSGSSSDLFGDPEFSYGAAVARFNLPFETVNLTAFGGVAKFRVETNLVNTSDEEPIIGVGLDLFASPNSALTLELYQVGDTDDPLDVLSIGYMRRFGLPKLR